MRFMKVKVYMETNMLVDYYAEKQATIIVCTRYYPFMHAMTYSFYYNFKSKQVIFMNPLTKVIFTTARPGM